MQTIELILKGFQRHAVNRVDTLHKQRIDFPMDFGIVGLQHVLQFHPGVVLLYAHPDMGKTSVAKRVAQAMFAQGNNVVYYDAEGKLYLHDLDEMQGILLANAYRDSGMKELVASGLTDTMIIDTITGVSKSAQVPFLQKIQKTVPYIMVVAQMRDDFKTHLPVPACDVAVSGCAHTIMQLTGKETITIESLDMMRVQYIIVKHEGHPKLSGMRGSFIIRNNIVDNIYTAYDILKTRGLVRTVGRDKYVGKHNLKSIKGITPGSAEERLLIGEAEAVLVQEQGASGVRTLP